MVIPFLRILVGLMALTVAFGPPLLASDGESMRERNYYVRIGIIESIRKLALFPRGSYSVINSRGQAVATLSSNQICVADIVEGRLGGDVYRVILRSFSPAEESNAVVLARATEQAYGMPSRAIRISADPATARKERVIVTVGEFFALKDAEDFRASRDETKGSEIFRERSPAQQGRVNLKDPLGGFIASDPVRLLLRPESHDVCSMHMGEMKTSQDATPEGARKHKHYRGEIVLALDASGKLTVVNNVWLEYYLYGVVSSEMGESAPPEALRAQAVVARSTTVARIERGIVNDNPLFDLGDTSMDQVYDGKGTDSSAVRRAVDATRGEILVWDGDPVEAVYSHSCGGVIASAGDMWGSTHLKYFRRKEDRLGTSEKDLSSNTDARYFIESHPSCFCSPNQKDFPSYATKNFRWIKTSSGTQLSANLDKGYGTGAIKDIVVERRSKSGRISVLKITGEKKTIRLDKEMPIRSALGGVKSIFCVLDRSSDVSGRLSSLTVRGGGYGHGVGMCQIGAYMMGKQNFSYRQILGHYFVDVKIRRLYG